MTEGQDVREAAEASQPSVSDVLEAITALRADIDQQFTDLAEDINGHLVNQDLEHVALISFLEKRFTSIDRRLEALTDAPRQVTTMPAPRQRVG